MVHQLLPRIQEEREERHRVKSHLKPSRFEPISSSPSTSRSSIALGPILTGIIYSILKMSLKKNSYYFKSDFIEEKTGSFDVGDPNTTNIYLGNINPKVYF